MDACQTTSGSESAKAGDQPQPERKQKVAVVEMVAGGWSFTVRDQDGAVYVWGELHFPSSLDHMLYRFILHMSYRG